MLHKSYWEYRTACRMLLLGMLTALFVLLPSTIPSLDNVSASSAARAPRGLPSTTPTPTHYNLCVNCGGYVSLQVNWPDSRICLADQPWATPPLDWGYEAGTMVTPDAACATMMWEPCQRAALEGLNAQLMREQRSAPGSYRFSVPNGRYDVEVGFAEVRWRETPRFFNVKAEGTVIFAAVNPAAMACPEKGHVECTSYVTSTVVAVSDGVLNLEFDSCHGCNAPPIVSFIRIAESAPDFGLITMPILRKRYPIPTCEEFVKDGDFGLEETSDQWYPAHLVQCTPVLCRSGACCGRLGWQDDVVEVLCQDVELPVPLVSAKMAFYYYLPSEDSKPGADVFEVTIESAESGELIKRVARLDNLQANWCYERFPDNIPDSWVELTRHDLNAIENSAGSIRVCLKITTDEKDFTAALVDDVSLRACYVSD